jgi:DNA repair ATPase RecN
METLSRVKKYQALRNEIENDREEELVSPALSSYAERLNKIDPLLSKQSTQGRNESYEALHFRREQAINTNDEFVDKPLETDYIQEFLEEVRNYNLSKGYRKEFDTELDILKKHGPVGLPVNETIKPLVDDSPVNDDLTLQIKTLIENDFEEAEELSNSNEPEELTQVLEETQKLRIQLSDYEKELVNMNESVLSSHRVLNMVVFFLVLVLIVMLGFAIYWVLYSKGYY